MIQRNIKWLAGLSGARNVIIMGDPPNRIEFALESRRDRNVVSVRDDDAGKGEANNRNDEWARVTVVVEATGHPSAFNEGFNLLGMNGRYLILGLWPANVQTSIDPIRINNLNSNIIESLVIERGEYQETVRISTEHGKKLNFADFITHQFRLDDISEGIRTETWRNDCHSLLA